MTDSKKPSIPAWQQSSPDAASQPEDKALELARRFLADESVKAANPAEKRAFLKSKGLEDAQITQLLDGSLEESQSSSASHSTTESSTKPDDVVEPPETQANDASSSSTDSSEAEASAAVDSPLPIITYPEFLTKPERPPPLITPSRLANIVAVAGGVWALFYGIAGLAVGPMADKLNDSRAEYYSHVNTKLTKLVEKLERTASEVPYKNGKPLKPQQHDRAINDNESVSSDPTELFHRDIGTQTSPRPSFTGATSDAANGTEKPIDSQARRLAAIGSALRDTGVRHMENAASKADLKAQFDEIQGHLDKLAYPPVQDFSNFGGYGYGQSTEPDDEFKKTKNAIRSVKGLLLSTRSFPVVAPR
ncbi:peroxisomal membrane anchor protein conserved region-domain-containing protein [Xylaria intraflava]|nr:peroxisomal membrane anchor protein conserved region-domain-containing protein [Xylaria intraflava]